LKGGLISGISGSCWIMRIRKRPKCIPMSTKRHRERTSTRWTPHWIQKRDKRSALLH
jgi:hypothetical protein